MNIDRHLVEDLVAITNVVADGPPDGFGDPTETTTTTLVAGAYFPGPVGDDDPDRPDGRIDGTVFVRPDVAVSATSRVTVARVGVVDASVVGRPRRWHDARTDRVAFIQIEVTET